MSKIVRLTESDLVRIVKRVISEQDITTPSIKGKKITKKALTIQQVKPGKNKDQFEIYASEGNQPTNTFMIFGCKWHEGGKYMLFPNNDGSNTLKPEESQMLYNELCKPMYKDTQNMI